MIKCCHYCTKDRYPGCHGECNLYYEWKSKLEKVNEERKKYNQLYDNYKKNGITYPNMDTLAGVIHQLTLRNLLQE